MSARWLVVVVVLVVCTARCCNAAGNLSCVESDARVDQSCTEVTDCQCCEYSYSAQTDMRGELGPHDRLSVVCSGQSVSWPVSWAAVLPNGTTDNGNTTTPGPPLDTHITKVYLDNTGLTELRDDDFADIKRYVAELHLQRNAITNISNATFANMSHLCHLDLSNLRMYQLPDGIFTDLVRLKTLVMTDTLLLSLSPTTFLTNTALTKVVLSDQNGLVLDDPAIFYPLTKLQWLEVQGHNITVYCQVFAALSNKRTTVLLTNWACLKYPQPTCPSCPVEEEERDSLDSLDSTSTGGGGDGGDSTSTAGGGDDGGDGGDGTSTAGGGDDGGDGGDSTSTAGGGDGFGNSSSSV